MDVFVANGTMQSRQFSYRRREDMRPEAQPKTLEIPAGMQVQFPGEYDGEGLQFIIGQLERSGAVPYNDLTAITKPHTLVYRVQKAIESDIIDQTLEMDMGARETVAADQMEKSGLQAFTAAQVTLKANGIDPATVQETTVEITEVNDVKTVAGGVNMEVTVSAKPGKAGKLERAERKQRR